MNKSLASRPVIRICQSLLSTFLNSIVCRFIRSSDTVFISHFMHFWDRGFLTNDKFWTKP
jgi:hypothetical protein